MNLKNKLIVRITKADSLVHNTKYFLSSLLFTSVIVLIFSIDYKSFDKNLDYIATEDEFKKAKSNFNAIKSKNSPEKNIYLEKNTQFLKLAKIKKTMFENKIKKFMYKVNDNYQVIELLSINHLQDTNKIEAVLDIKIEDIKKEAILIYLLSQEFYLFEYKDKDKKAKIYYQFTNNRGEAR